MSIEYLRAKALAFAPRFRYPLCLDEAKRAAIDAATQTLVDLHAELADLDSLPAEQKRAKSISSKSPAAVLRDKIKDAEKAVEQAEAEAADDMLVLTWKALDPDAYTDLALSHMKGGSLNQVTLYPALVAASWAAGESADGEDVRLTFDQVRPLLNAADWDVVMMGVLNLNRGTNAVPFKQRSSGVPGTSSEPA